MRDFDECFSNYLETYEADKMYNSFFTAVRKAFIAGYKAAGGEIPKEQPVFTIIDFCEMQNSKKQAVVDENKPL